MLCKRTKTLLLRELGVQVFLTVIVAKFHLMASYLNKTSKYLNNCRITLTLHAIIHDEYWKPQICILGCVSIRSVARRNSSPRNQCIIHSKGFFQGKISTDLQAKVSHIAYLAVQSACLTYLFSDMLGSTTCIFSWYSATEENNFTILGSTKQT